MRKTPAAIIGFSLLLALVTAAGLPVGFVAVTSAVLFCAAFVMSAVRGRGLLAKLPEAASIIAFTLAVGFALSAAYAWRISAAPLSSAGSFDFTARVEEASLEDDCRYTLKAETINGEKIDAVRLELRSDFPLGCDIYENVSGKAMTLERYKDADISAVVSLADGEKLTVEPTPKSGAYSMLTKVRKRLSDELAKFYDGDVLDFMRSVLLGNKYALDASKRSDFRLSGLSHVIVVSGMHFTLICGTLLKLLGLLSGFRRRLCAGLTIPFTLAFAFVIGATPSVIRAAVSMIIMLLGLIADERPDGLNSLGISVILVGVFAPGMATSLSFLLSVFSVLGMLVMSRRLDKMTDLRFKSRTVRFILKMITPCVGAQLAVTPLVLITFSGFSLMSVVSNVLIFYAVSIALALGAATVIISLIGLAPIAVVLGFIAGISAEYCLAVTHVTAQVPNSYLTLGAVIACVVAAAWATALLSAACSIKPRISVPVCCAVIAAAVITNAYVRANSLRVTAGYGYCIAESSSAAVFIDTGSSGRESDSLCGRYFGEVEVACCRDKATVEAVLNAFSPRLLITEHADFARQLGFTGEIVAPGVALNIERLHIESDEAEVTLSYGGETVKVVGSDGEASPDCLTFGISRYGESTLYGVKNKAVVGEHKTVYNDSGATVTVFKNGKIYATGG